MALIQPCPVQRRPSGSAPFAGKADERDDGATDMVRRARQWVDGRQTYGRAPCYVSLLGSMTRGAVTGKCATTLR